PMRVLLPPASTNAAKVSCKKTSSPRSYTVGFPRLRRSVMTQSAALSNIRIASPCHVSWEQMSGNNQQRHCSQCDLDVYNFSEMTGREVKPLIAASKDRRLGALFSRRGGGTRLPGDCPVGGRTRARRISRRAGAALAAVM